MASDELEVTDLVEQFMAITGAEDTVAMLCLQQSGWNVQSAVNIFLDQASSDNKGGNRNNPIIVSEDDLSASCTESLSNKQHEAEQSNPNLTVLSWNVDGLDKRNIQERTRKVCHTINCRKPDAVLLQEVISETLAIYQSKCPGYLCIYEPTHGAYFNIMLLKGSSIKPTSNHHCTHFSSSQMGRQLLCQSAMFRDKIGIILMTSHLESTVKCKDERKRQLEQVLASMTEQPEQATVVFGGDTNLRDTEVSAIGGLPSNIVDAWEQCGRPKEAEFTWDMQVNNNLDWPYSRKPKTRFDRLFLRPGQGPHALKATHFELVGMERLPGCRRFPSDHWGVSCEFTDLGKLEKKNDQQ